MVLEIFNCGRSPVAIDIRRGPDNRLRISSSSGGVVRALGMLMYDGTVAAETAIEIFPFPEGIDVDCGMLAAVPHETERFYAHADGTHACSGWRPKSSAERTICDQCDRELMSWLRITFSPEPKKEGRR